MYISQSRLKLQINKKKSYYETQNTPIMRYFE